MKIYRYGDTIVSLENIMSIEFTSATCLIIKYLGNPENEAWISIKRGEKESVFDEIEKILKEN